MKILWLCLECAEPHFSGNGTLSKSIIPTFLQFPNIKLFVVCALPDDQTKAVFPFPYEGKDFQAETVKVPASKWRSLRRDGSWKEYEEGIGVFQKKILDFKPDVVVGVDWHSLGPLKKIYPDQDNRPPFIYLNFRAFFASPGFDEDEKNFYKVLEKECCVISSKAITLGTPDAHLLHVLSNERIFYVTCSVSPSVIELAKKIATSPQPDREFFLCCCRISQEKTIETFVGVVERLSSYLQEKQIRPYLCGARSDKDYASSITSRLLKACPTSVIVDYVTLEQLTDVYRRSILNFHPSFYEAYGLTIVEAGCFGCPSITNDSPDIGALDFLDPSKGEVFTAKLEDLDQTAAKIKSLFDDPKKLDEVGRTVAKKGISYTTVEYCQKLFDHIKEVLDEPHMWKC